MMWEKEITTDKREGLPLGWVILWLALGLAWLMWR